MDLPGAFDVDHLAEKLAKNALEALKDESLATRVHIAAGLIICKLVPSHGNAISEAVDELRVGEYNLPTSRTAEKLVSARGPEARPAVHTLAYIGPRHALPILASEKPLSVDALETLRHIGASFAVR